MLAGCFLLGALSLVKPQLLEPKLRGGPPSAESTVLLVTLYAVAAGCLIGAVIMFVLGVRGLLRVLQDGPPVN